MILLLLIFQEIKPTIEFKFQIQFTHKIIIEF